MFLSIDFQSDVAIYSQIVRQIKAAIASGAMKPGQLLPSGRTLSTQLAINPNTVARAYTQLQSDGVIETLRGRGMVIATGAVSVCRRDRDEVIASGIADALSEAWNAGLDADKIQSIIDRELRRLSKTTPAVRLESSVEDSAVPATTHTKKG